MPPKELRVQARRTMTVRLTQPQWRRVRAFALELDTSVQDMLIAGLNRIFVEHGQEQVDPDSPLLPPGRKRRRSA